MFVQVFHVECLSQTSYLVGDDATGAAFLVDPQKGVDRYYEVAEQRGLTVRHAFFTHFARNLYAGHEELDLLGVHLYAGRQADQYLFTPLQKGFVMRFGSVRLEVLETPECSSEGVSFLVYDLTRSPDRPHAVFAGDALVGIEEGVVSQECSRHFLDLPDETLLLPAYCSATLRGKAPKIDNFSSIGDLRREESLRATG